MDLEVQKEILWQHFYMGVLTLEELRTEFDEIEFVEQSLDHPEWIERDSLIVVALFSASATSLLLYLYR